MLKSSAKGYYSYGRIDVVDLQFLPIELIDKIFDRLMFPLFYCEELGIGLWLLVHADELDQDELA